MTMSEKFIGNNQPAVIDFLETITDTTDADVINSGYDNLVVITEGKLYRFPRNGEVWERGLVERTILDKLSNHSDLAVPKLLEVHEDPAYAVLTSLPGQNLTPEEMRALPPDAQDLIGQQIGDFAFKFHSLFSPDEVRDFLSDRDPQTSYSNYLQKILPDNDPHAKWVRDNWGKFEHKDTTVIHDDLHTHNMLFNENHKLSGVIDFGDVNLGSPEQELRYVYWISDIVFESAISEYERLSGKSLDRELVKICAISQEISGLYDPKRSYMHDRARQNLSYRKASDL